MALPRILQRFERGLRSSLYGGRRRALLIGINYIHQQNEKYGRLKGPIDDVKIFAKTLIGKSF